IDEMRGKVVVVYYWASWNGQTAGDFSKLASVLKTGGNEVAVLGVNLDTKAEDGRAFVRKTSPVGTHVHHTGGLDGRLATHYWIMVLPTVFVVGKDGKVGNRSAQVVTVEEEVKKLLKTK